MHLDKTKFQRWLVVFFYATAMAWVESAVVFYLRTMIHRIEPYQAHPFPLFLGFAKAELIRELATLLMLLTVGWLAGTNLRSRIGYSAVAFGVWDIFYYVFLRVMAPWPNSLMDWDVLFLIPLPWWGPVMAPVMISLLMIAWGTLAGMNESLRLPRTAFVCAWWLNATGMVLALLIFMKDSIRCCLSGQGTIREVLPDHFRWPWFLIAITLMSAPVVLEIYKMLRSTQRTAKEKIGRELIHDS